MCISNPDSPDCIIDNPVVIKDNLTNYWANLSKSNKPTNTNLVENLQHLDNTQAETLYIITR